MPGMMTGAQMAQLTASSGRAFDRAFLHMMITHHEGGIAMARDELAGGHDPDALALAKNISDAQQVAVDLAAAVRHVLTGRDAAAAGIAPIRVAYPVT